MLGRRHTTIRHVRSLRSDSSLRESERLFLAEGIHLSEEALKNRAPVRMALFSSRLMERPGGERLLKDLVEAPFPVEEVSVPVLDSILDARTPQGVVMIVERPTVSLKGLLDAGSERMLFVVTVGLQDPGNLGTILRTADAAGASALVATGEHVDLFHPRAVRATAGSIFRLPAVRVTETDKVLDALLGRAVTVAGASSGQGTPYDRFDWTASCALLLGSEGSGLPGEIWKRPVTRVTIPIREPVESLSVGAAAAVLLFEAARQRQQ